MQHVAQHFCVVSCRVNVARINTLHATNFLCCKEQKELLLRATKSRNKKIFISVYLYSPYGVFFFVKIKVAADLHERIPMPAVNVGQDVKKDQLLNENLEYTLEVREYPFTTNGPTNILMHGPYQ